jgi:solute carrier family 6 amino acid transporter-like protein 5/7/9/14
MSVGLGNVWRFPYVAYTNGGGAFLIPYIFVLLFIGRPLYLLELGLGQFSSSGSARVWDMAPAFRGVGYGQVMATTCVLTYYCTLIGLSIFYLGSSLYPTLPWTDCDEKVVIPMNKVCLPSKPVLEAKNLTRQDFPLGENQSIMTSAEQFFTYGVLKSRPDNDITDGLGLPDPTLLGALAVTWIILYFSLRGGVGGQGKVAYFTAIFPYLVLLTLLVRGLTLPGFEKGLALFFTPKWEKLIEPKVWYAAVTQSFFSLSVGFGSLTTYASFNKFRHPTSRDALIISFADTFTSLLAGTVIFAILGHLAHETGQEVEDVVKSSAGLAFISYPEVLASFPASNFFSVVFFLMLITLGLGSAIGLLSSVTTTLTDSFPSVDKKTIIKLCCAVGFAIGIFYVTPGGMLMLDMVDHYGGTMLILGLASLEVIGIAWVYGTNVVTRDFNFMFETELSVYWRICWGFICPLLLPGLFIYLVFVDGGPFVGVDIAQSSKQTMTICGYMLAGAGLLLVPVHLLFAITADEQGERFLVRLWNTVRGGRFGGKLCEAFQPNNSWGPSSIKERTDWQVYSETHSKLEFLPSRLRSRLEKDSAADEQQLPK